MKVYAKKVIADGAERLALIKGLEEDFARAYKALSKAKYVAVIDKSISIGTEGILSSDIKRACYGQMKAPIKSFVVGLGGRDVTEKMIGDIVEMAKGKAKETGFVGK